MAKKNHRLVYIETLVDEEGLNKALKISIADRKAKLDHFDKDVLNYNNIPEDPLSQALLQLAHSDRNLEEAWYFFEEHCTQIYTVAKDHFRSHFLGSTSKYF